MNRLFPIRIDARSEDGSVRLVDTLLIDPGCLPISLSPDAQEEGRHTCAVQSCIDENVHEIVDTLLADMEVQSTSRTAKHFTGRADLLNIPSLRHHMEKQVRDQLQVALLVFFGGGEHSATTDGSSIGENKKEEGKEENGREQSKLVNIKLRIRDHNVVILDEFDYDPTSAAEEGGCPIAIANGIVNDLNLPPECAVSIATSIVEQVHGLTVEGDISGMDEKKAQRDTPAAWAVDEKEATVLQAQFVADSQPQNPTVKGAIQKR